MPWTSQLWALLPLVVGAAVYRRCAMRSGHGPEAVFESFVLLLAGIWVVSNALSVAQALHPAGVRTAWVVAALGAVVAWCRRREVRSAWPRVRGAVEWALAAGIVALLLITLARALLAPPSTVDVLNYHLPRQLLWLQQGSLDPFVTINDRQNMMPPLAELVGLQFLALTGDDLWVNLPQWGAYALTALGLVRLTRQLGGSRGVALSAALVGLLIPMAYHEASNAKNDLFVAVLLLALALQLQRWRRATPAPARSDAAKLGVTVALACLVKSTALVYAPLLVGCALLSWTRCEGWRRVLPLAAVAGFAVIVFLAPFLMRNQAWYGKPLGEHRAEDGGAQSNEAMSPALLASNVVRHASLHLTAPGRAWNEALFRAVHRVHSWLAVDVNEPRTTLWVLKYRPDYAPATETVAGAPAHFVVGVPLLLLAIVGALRRRPVVAEGAWLAMAALLGALAFCAVVKWQPWGARLQLPLFVLGVAPAMAACAGWRPGRGRIGLGVLLATATLAWLPGADTETRPLWSGTPLWASDREANYYRVLPFAARDDALVKLARESGARHVYVHNLHDIAYPLMRKLRRMDASTHFAGAPAGRFAAVPPDAVISLALGAPLPLYGAFAGRDDWRLVGDTAGDGFYLPKEEVDALGWRARVPLFTGFVREQGLSLPHAHQWGGQKLLARSLDAPVVKLGYLAHGRSLVLRVSAVRTDERAEPLTVFVQVEDGTIWSVSLANAGQVQSFELPMPAATGPHVVEIFAEGEFVSGTVLFTRLQLAEAESAHGGNGSSR